MKLKKGDPSDPKVTEAIVEMIRKMTPEEAIAFFTYRTPGVEETDMTGMYSPCPAKEETLPAEHRITTK